MKKQIIIIASVIVLVGIFATFFFSNNSSPTGSAIENIHTYTKAICNESNFCQDHEITCRGEEVIESKPIKGAVVQHTKEWEDPRQNSESLCNFSDIN